MRAVGLSKETEKPHFSKAQIFVALFALLECLTHFGVIQGDSPGYIDMVKLFRGTATAQEALVVQWHGMLRPVVPLLAVPISFLTDYANAIAAVDTVFILVGTLFMYRFAAKLFSDQIGLVAALGFASAAPVLGYGAAVLTDGPGYAMLIVLVYMVVFVLPRKQGVVSGALLGVLLGVAVLTKETNAIIFVFLPLFYLLNRDRFNLRSVIIVMVLGLVIPLAWSEAIHHSYLMFYGEGLTYAGSGYQGPMLHPRLFMISVVLAFTLLVPFGFMAFFTLEDVSAFKTLALVLLCSGALVLAWPTLPETRLTFLIFPAVVPFSAVGIGQAAESLSKRPLLSAFSREQWLAFILLAVIAVTNASRGYFHLP